MSSRSGPRATGSDGMDFLHRERVAGHYKTSATNKWRMKFVSILHIFLLLLMLARLSTSLFVMFGFRPPSMLQRMKLPRGNSWEFAWLMSGAATLVGLMALRRNKIVLLKQYMLGIITFGLGPVFYALYDLCDDMWDYYNTHDAKLKFQGFPLVILWSMFLAISMQLHFFGIYFAWQLKAAWQPRGGKKTK